LGRGGRRRGRKEEEEEEEEEEKEKEEEEEEEEVWRQLKSLEPERPEQMARTPSNQSWAQKRHA
jgi:hypothetical protein